MTAGRGINRGARSNWCAIELLQRLHTAQFLNEETHIMQLLRNLNLDVAEQSKLDPLGRITLS